MTLLSWRPRGHRGVRRRWWRPTARCKQEKKQQCTSKNWTYSWRLCFLKKLPQLFLSGSSVRIMGIPTTGPAVKNHVSPKGKRINWLQYIKLCAIRSTWFISSFSTTHLLHHHLHNRIPSLTKEDTPKIQYLKEVEVRVRSYGESCSINQQKPKTKIKMKDGRSTKHLLHDLPGWLQDFRENLVDERSPTTPQGFPAPKDRDTASSCHELPMESRAKVKPGSGKNSVYTHFPKDPNCDICLKTKISRSSCRRRAGTLVPRADNFGDLITADYKILSEESESRNNHRYVVVLQDLATQWLQSCPCKTKTSQETQKSPMKFLEPR